MHEHTRAHTGTHTKELQEETVTAADPEEWNRVTGTQDWEETFTLCSL